MLGRHRHMRFPQGKVPFNRSGKQSKNQSVQVPNKSLKKIDSILANEIVRIACFIQIYDNFSEMSSKHFYQIAFGMNAYIYTYFNQNKYKHVFLFLIACYYLLVLSTFSRSSTPLFRNPFTFLTTWWKSCEI